MQAFELCCRCRFIAAFIGDRRHRVAEHSHAYFVTNYLRRHREIQRTISRIGRDIDQISTKTHLLVRETRGLRPQQNGRLRSRRLCRDQFSAVPWRHDRARHRPHSRARTDDKPAIFDRFLERCAHARRCQYVVGARCARNSLIVWKAPRPNENEIRQPHGLHRTRDGADVSGVCGLDQNDAYRYLHGRHTLCGG